MEENFAKNEKTPYETLRKEVQSNLKKNNSEISYSQFSDEIDELNSKKIISVHDGHLIRLELPAMEATRHILRLESYIKSEIDAVIADYAIETSNT